MKSFFFYYKQTFKNIVKNNSVFTTLIASILMYSFFYPTAYKAQVAENIPIVIVDEEQSVLSSKIISQTASSPHIQIQAVTGNFLEAEQMVKNQKAEAILLLPENLSQSLRRGEMGGIGLYLSTAYFLQTKEAATGLATSIEYTLKEHLEKFGEASQFEIELPIHDIPLFNTLSGYGSYIFPAVASLIIHQTILLGLAMLIASYREQGWSAQPVEFWAIFATILTISGLGSLYLYGFTFWLYEYPHGGNFWGMLLAVPIYVSCVIGLGMLLGSLVDMPERVGHLVVVTSVPLFLLTGAAWPHAAMPEWMQWFAWTLPSTHGVQMFVQLNQMGVPTSIVVPKLIYLSTVGAVLLALSYYRLIIMKPIKKEAI
ncbi:ABC transporter permease [Acinetobacter haemolyticus]|uniref:ABC transporter permease n=1 Tax=Acinetobacter haemolyticus TaxID=29430 RepID=UPI002A69F439|nr:ABC transporter permease [Acinetobacter haemolyticus]WPO68219.1 ABC transporter permease [Acinetobacter haemolyticus]